jgi:hypothetical protein
MPSDPNARRVMILSSEVDSAAAMMALVKYATDADLIRRYKEVALRSYRSAIDLIVITSLTSTEDQEIWDRLNPVRQWLEEAGLLTIEAPRTIAVDTPESRELAAVLTPKRTV